MAMIKLQSSDEQDFEVPRAVAEQSGTIKNMLTDMEGIDADMPIPLPNVTAKILEKVLAHCRYHLENPTPITEANKDEQGKPVYTNEIIPWDLEFCRQLEQAELFELMLAANYLEIKPLLDLTCKTVANMIKGKSPEEIRKTFNIKNDFTPEEEEQVRKENEWCEER